MHDQMFSKVSVKRVTQRRNAQRLTIRSMIHRNECVVKEGDRYLED
jgi:hypothetical protein